MASDGGGDGGRRRRRKRRPRLAPRFARALTEGEDNGGGSPGERVRQPLAFEPQAADEGGELARELLQAATSRCFIVKSFSEANLHKSLKFGVWSSTYAHNAALDQAFGSDLAAARPVLLLFSVCGAKHFSGIARMTSRMRTGVRFELWEKAKYEGVFHVEWLLVKDVPNFVLTDIKMSNTPTKKSITSCRDGEEVMFDEASRFISVFTQYPSRSSAWDDFEHFERQQEQLERKRGLQPADRSDLECFLTPV